MIFARKKLIYNNLEAENPPPEFSEEGFPWYLLQIYG